MQVTNTVTPKHKPAVHDWCPRIMRHKSHPQALTVPSQGNPVIPESGAGVVADAVIAKALEMEGCYPWVQALSTLRVPLRCWCGADKSSLFM